ncbi:Putative uncharacterized protein [Taphrina deformans PYCC 5710]|uniref:Kinesin motor domain-containing protein n=1 Tax=Taphrina deformans (strain PYCC 5710 / ATCC 11124 / CBS 356.35 / IMI 108563 / JCM 9778 / NBRC 8474) TaxID=1097556 RepID=R4X9F4_TAPDE|nr:Putative uncharacterized protein [Taphrina deformans PYCC 5710]|eukprot:CCG80844.1 Putative uncharacterized protein [Taphrina deformans PYCC 5710]
MSGVRPPTTSSRPPSRASSHPSETNDRQVPLKRAQSATARTTEQNTATNAVSSASETNIQVVVRCRDRNKREIEENSGVIISPSKDGHSITVQTSALTELNNKTYTFDKVFGGGSSQQDVFDVTVEPIVQEMLGGYNCTIFAYGQTGTGKTYTMSGDMSDHCGGIPPATAGIIPRALCRIFQVLDQAGDEYSVKCSFIELYNEELRDLLSTQDDSKVKIFDDSTKKGGIIINGMEELAVNDATHGVKILQEGSRKREVAATKCNEASSRSHSVFTITVHIKQTSTEGEDMLRVGKLYLVDLAGSENVGRSGAENKRAREAGMINQSLLTLGRVINALVDRSQHVPYRESKLTRLLQDSLGGRTKTCIIATLSPAKINMDETVSTLEYANRAKSIKNKPQVNQMMTKKALIKDYIIEIERLKGDLNSTRMKNGVYMTEESHLELVNQNESNKLLTEEQQRKIDAMEAQLQSAKEQFESTMAAYTTTKKTLEKTSKDLLDTESTLSTTKDTLATTSLNLEKESLLRRAHQQSEIELNTVAITLKDTLATTVEHVKGLHAKVDRKRDVEQANQSSWTDMQGNLCTVAQSIDGTLAKYSKAQSRSSKVIADRVTSFVIKEMKLFSDGHQYMDMQLQAFQERKAQVDTTSTGARVEMETVLGEIKSLREEVKSRLGDGLQNLNVAAQRIAEEISGQMGLFQKDIYESYDGLASEFKQVFSRTEAHINSQSAEIRKLKEALHAASQTNTTLIEQISKELIDTQDSNSREAQAKEAEALQQIQMMLSSIASEREARMQEARNAFKNKIEGAITEMHDQSHQNGTAIDLWTNADGVYGRKLAKDKDEIRKAIVNSWNTAKERSETIQQSTEAIHRETVHLVDAAMQNVDDQTRALDEFVTRAKKMNEAHHAEQHIAVSALLTNAQETAQSVQHEFNKAKSEIEACGKDILGKTAEQVREVQEFSTDLGRHTEAVKQNSQTALREDRPTQTTPKKQDYVYPTSWKTTAVHEELLAQYRGVEVEEVSLAERNPLSIVDVNVTSPILLQASLGPVEDELAIPVVQKSSIPGPRARGSGEKETIRAIGSGGQENGPRPPKTRKRALA